MFQHFNSSLWQQISSQYEDFWAELHFFRMVNSKVGHFCKPIMSLIKSNVTDTDMISWLSRLEIQHSPWNQQFSVTTYDCLLMVIHEEVFR